MLFPYVQVCMYWKATKEYLEKGGKKSSSAPAAQSVRPMTTRRKGKPKKE